MSFSFSARLRRCQWKTGFPTRFSFRSAQSINGCNGKRDTDSARFLASRPYERPLFGRLIVARGLLQFLEVLRRERWPVDLQRQLFELASEAERHLVVCIVPRRAGVGADVEVLIPLHNQWD